MAETIREFLVSLGFKTDEASLTKFTGGISVATKGVLAFAATVTAAQTAISATITKIAAGFDELYWMSQRTKSSAENIKSVGYAVSQLGGSYRGAVSSIEEFARRMRSNPGYEAMARNLGVVTRENGKLRDTTAIMTDLSEVLSKKPQYVALQYLEALGIDEATYNALKSGDLVRYTEEYRKKQQALGVDQSRAAEIGKDLTNAWRALGATAQTVGEKLMQELGPGLKDFVERVDAFLMRNSDRIVEFFKKAAEFVGKLMDAFVQLVEKGEGPIVDMFEKIMKSVDTLEKVLVAFAAFLVGSWVLSILGAFTRVGAGWAALLLRFGINPVTLMAGGALALSTSPANGGEDEEIARRRANGTWGKTPNDGTAGAPPQITDKRNWWQRTMPKILGGQDAPQAAGSAGVGGSRSWRNNNPGNIEYGPFAKRMGATSTDGRFAIFPDYETGRKAQEELLFNSEGYRNLTLAQAIKRWAPASENNVPAYIAAMGVNDPDKLMSQYTAEERKKLLDAMQKHEGWREGKPTAGPGLLASVTGAAKDAGLTVTSGYRSPDHPLSLANPSSAHSRGMAFDSRAKTAEEADAAMAKIQAMMAAKGLVEGRDFKILDEVRNPSGWATGPHIHTEFTASGAKLWGGDLPKGDMPAPKWPPMSPSQIAAMKNGGGAGVAANDKPDVPPLAKITPSTLANVQANAALVGGGATPGASAPLTPGATTNATTTITMSPKTEVTILGGSDPQATGAAVADAQNGVNGRLLRNMQGATR